MSYTQRRMLGALLVGASLAGATLTSPYITPEMDKHLMRGVDLIYQMKFEEAEREANEALKLNPEHPHAYLGLAGVSWTKYVYGPDQDDPKLLAEYEQRTKKAAEVASAWNKKHPDDAGGFMTAGAAYGLWSRLLIIQHHWVSGYFKGTTALKLTKQSVKLDPELWDGYLGLGMYDYYSDLYPHFIGALAKIVLRGNRERGIQYLRTVAEKGHYSQSNAKILLVEIYTEDPFGAKDGKKAVELMKDLRARYPEGSMMHAAEFVAEFTAGDYEKSLATAREYTKLAKAGTYGAVEISKGETAEAVNLWALKRTDEAWAKCRDAMAHKRKDGRLSRWAQWSRIKCGNMLDSLGRREEAVKLYKEVVAEPDTWDFRDIAKSFVSKPYSSSGPDRIPPP